MTSISDPTVLLEYPSVGVLVLRLNRPSKRNALNNLVISLLADAIRHEEQKKEVRCIIIAGNKDFFSAGADVTEMKDRGIEAIQNRSRNADWSVLETTRLPIIAAVSGVCFGGGHELAMICDIVIASNTAKFAQPEIKLGHIPGDGATQRLPRRIGKYAAMKMILTGEPVSAEEAFRMGLVSEITHPENLETRALEIASMISRHSALALGLAKDAVRAAEELPLSAGLEREKQNIAIAFTTKDQKEGLAAFLEKRAPKFCGQ